MRTSNLAAGPVGLIVCAGVLVTVSLGAAGAGDQQTVKPGEPAKTPPVGLQFRAEEIAGDFGIGYAVTTGDVNGDGRTDVIDDGGMATEDLVVADLNGDKQPDIIASGRATHNVKIYWNESRPARR
jgi:FG-GAP repeat